MTGKKMLKGTVTISRALCGMTKFLKVPVQTVPRPRGDCHGISYVPIEKRFLEMIDVVDSSTTLVDA